MSDQKDNNMNKKLINKYRISAFLFAYFSIISIGSLAQSHLNPCFTNGEYTGYLLAKRDIRPASSKNYRELPTLKGTVKVSVDEGVRIIYNNRNQAPFVNIKIERSIAGNSNKDKENLLAHLKYLIGKSSGLKEKSLASSTIGGYTLYHYSSNDFNKSYILTSYVFFPEEGITVYVDFHNLPPKYRTFKDQAAYQDQRDRFIKEYISHIRSCLSTK